MLHVCSYFKASVGMAHSYCHALICNVKNGADLCVKGGNVLRECCARSGNKNDDFAIFGIHDFSVDCIVQGLI